MSYDCYLTSDEHRAICDFHKEHNRTRFHYMHLYYDNLEKPFPHVYSYYADMGYINMKERAIYLRYDAFDISPTTTRQLKRFIREYNLTVKM